MNHETIHLVKYKLLGFQQEQLIIIDNRKRTLANCGVNSWAKACF